MGYRIAALLWMAVIFVLSMFRPPRISEVTIPYFDKIAHFFIYLVLAFLLSGWFNNTISPLRKATLAVLTASILYGITMETLQGVFLPYRSFEFQDILANIIGCLAGVVLYKLIFSPTKP